MLTKDFVSSHCQEVNTLNRLNALYHKATEIQMTQEAKGTQQQFHPTSSASDINLRDESVASNFNCLFQIIQI